MRRWTARRRQRLEQVGPDIPIVEGLSRPILWRRVDPAPAGFQHMDDAADDPLVVDPRLAAGVGAKMRRDLRKLRFGQPEMLGNHRRFLSETVNHAQAITPTILWVRTLVQTLIQRATIVLDSADLLPAQEVGRRAGVSRWCWQLHYAEEGVNLPGDKTRKPGPAPLTQKVVARVLELTCTQPASASRIPSFFW